MTKRSIKCSSGEIERELYQSGTKIDLGPSCFIPVQLPQGQSVRLRILSILCDHESQRTVSLRQIIPICFHATLSYFQYEVLTCR